MPDDSADPTSSRKVQHVKIVLEKDVQHTTPAGFDDVQFLHYALPEINYDEINTEVKFLGRKFSLPFMVLSMTGGHETVEKINKDTAEVVALAAIKYSFLKSEARKNIVFELQESVSTAGNSGPYLLYTYARCQSVIAKSSSISPITHIPPIFPTTPEEICLLRAFFRFPEVVFDAATSYSPHLICTYLYDLAQKFNLFYEKCSILKADEETKQLRLNLTTATAQILKNGLRLLGIDTLDRI